MTLQQLRYLIAISQYQSFVKAAESCHVAQPSLSVQIQKLEDELGVSLFVRSAQRGVVPTEIGKQIITQAKVVLAESDRLLSLAHVSQNRVQGKVKLGMIPTVGPFLSPYFLKALVQKYPELKVQLYEEPTDQLVLKLNLGQIDAAILSPSEVLPPNLTEMVLYFESFVIFASTQHPILQSKEVRSSQLQNMSPTLLDETHCFRDQVEGLCAREVFSKDSYKLHAGSLMTLISVTEAQKSFTLLPTLVEPYLSIEQRRKQIRKIVSPTPYRKVSLVWNKNLGPDSLILTIGQVLVESLPGNVEKRLKSNQKVIPASSNHFRPDEG